MWGVRIIVWRLPLNRRSRFGDLSWSASSGLICFLSSLWHSLPQWEQPTPQLIALGFMLLHANRPPSPYAHNGGSGSSGFVLSGHLHENVLTKLLAFPWALGLDPRSSQGKVHRGWERGRMSLLIQQTAPLFWGVVLGPGSASMLLVLLPSPWKTSRDASVYFCIQALFQEKGSLTWGEENICSNLASKYLNSY